MQSAFSRIEPLDPKEEKILATLRQRRKDKEKEQSR
jgi:hypothetical protein